MMCAVQRFNLVSRNTAALVATLILGGCQSWILKPDTVDMAGTVGPIYMQQAVANLAKFADDPDTMPSQIEINTGYINLSSGVAPQVTVPFGNQVVRGASDVITSVTDTYRSFQLGGSVTRGGQWNIVAVSDPVRIKNLAALYRYANSGNVEQLEREYSVPINIDHGKAVIDSAYLASPLCVFCARKLGDADYSGRVPTDFKPGSENLNPMLKFEGQLIYARQPEDGGVDLSRYGKSNLWISTTNSRNHRLSDFVLFLLPLTTAPTPKP